MKRVKFRPFTKDDKKSVRLKKAPLELLMVQMRWPTHNALVHDFEQHVSRLAQHLDDYPLSEPARDISVNLTSDGVSASEGEKVYHYYSVDNIWDLHVTSHSVTLSFDPRYKGYGFSDVYERFLKLLEAVKDSFGVLQANRLGVRYINRITDEKVIGDISNAFKPQVIGYQDLLLQDEIELVTTMNQAVFQVEDISLNVRTGVVPPYQTPDRALKPVDTRSWVLDLQAVSTQNLSTQGTDIQNAVNRLSDTCYDFFKYVLLDEGEEKFGGK